MKNENTILLEGVLTVKKFREFDAELLPSLEGKHDKVTLVISSSGGDLSRGLGSILSLENLPCPLYAKIYSAGSIAALAALIATRRNIVKSGEIWLHFGCVERLESCDIEDDGKIPEKSLQLLRDYRSKLIQVITNVCPQLCEDKTLWSRLLASNRLQLTANQCLEYGIVDEITG